MFIRASVLRHFSETLNHSEKISVQDLILNDSVSYQNETGKRCKEHQNRTKTSVEIMKISYDGISFRVMTFVRHAFGK